MKAKEKDTQLTLRVLARIQLHDSKNPITAKQLCDIFGLNDIRQVTQLIETFRDAGHKIASSKGGFNQYLGRMVPSGYFLAKTPEEMRDTFDMYQSTIRQLSSRAKKLMAFAGQDTLWQQDTQDAA